MMSGLAHDDCWHEAAEVFKDMKFAGVILI